MLSLRFILGSLALICVVRSESGSGSGSSRGIDSSGSGSSFEFIFPEGLPSNLNDTVTVAFAIDVLDRELIDIALTDALQSNNIDDVDVDSIYVNERNTSDSCTPTSFVQVTLVFNSPEARVRLQLLVDDMAFIILYSGTNYLGIVQYRDVIVYLNARSLAINTSSVSFGNATDNFLSDLNIDDTVAQVSVLDQDPHEDFIRLRIYLTCPTNSSIELHNLTITAERGLVFFIYNRTSYEIDSTTHEDFELVTESRGCCRSADGDNAPELTFLTTYLPTEAQCDLLCQQTPNCFVYEYQYEIQKCEFKDDIIYYVSGERFCNCRRVPGNRTTLTTTLTTTPTTTLTTTATTTPTTTQTSTPTSTITSTLTTTLTTTVTTTDTSLTPSASPTILPSIPPSRVSTTPPSSSQPTSPPSSLPTFLPSTPPSRVSTTPPSSSQPTLPPSSLPTILPSTPPSRVSTTPPSSSQPTLGSHPPSGSPTHLSFEPTASPTYTPTPFGLLPAIFYYDADFDSVFPDGNTSNFDADIILITLDILQTSTEPSEIQTQPGSIEVSVLYRNSTLMAMLNDEVCTNVSQFDTVFEENNLTARVVDFLSRCPDPCLRYGCSADCLGIIDFNRETFECGWDGEVNECRTSTSERVLTTTQEEINARLETNPGDCGTTSSTLSPTISPTPLSNNPCFQFGCSAECIVNVSVGGELFVCGWDVETNVCRPSTPTLTVVTTQDEIDALLENQPGDCAGFTLQPTLPPTLSPTPIDQDPCDVFKCSADCVVNVTVGDIVLVCGWDHEFNRCRSRTPLLNVITTQEEIDALLEVTPGDCSAFTNPPTSSPSKTPTSLPFDDNSFFPTVAPTGFEDDPCFEFGCSAECIENITVGDNVFVCGWDNEFNWCQTSTVQRPVSTTQEEIDALLEQTPGDCSAFTDAPTLNPSTAPTLSPVEDSTTAPTVAPTGFEDDPCFEFGCSAECIENITVGDNVFVCGWDYELNRCRTSTSGNIALTSQAEINALFEYSEGDCDNFRSTVAPTPTPTSNPVTSSSTTLGPSPSPTPAPVPPIEVIAGPNGSGDDNWWVWLLVAILLLLILLAVLIAWANNQQSSDTPVSPVSPIPLVLPAPGQVLESPPPPTISRVGVSSIYSGVVRENPGYYYQDESDVYV